MWTLTQSQKALAKADKLLYPNLHTLLSIGTCTTLPVTSAVCERSISTLRFLKPAIRSTVTNARMNRFTMFVHRELASNIEPEAVVSEFAVRHSHRMELHDLDASVDADDQD